MGGAGKVGHPIGPGEVVGRLEEVERGALESQEKASLEFWGYGRRGEEAPGGGERHVEGAAGV